MSSYPERIKELMSERGVDVTRLKDALGISYQAVRKVVELGGAFGSENNLKAAEFFGVSPKWLATGVGNKLAKNYELAGDSGRYDIGKPTHSPAAEELATLYDLIPSNDTIRRARAYTSASAAILDVLQEPAGTAQAAQDQKKQSA